MFQLFKRKKQNESEENEMTTKDQIEKAKDNIEEEGKDSQTEKDRVDESVGEQEHEDHNEDSQDAKDRVDESEGEEKAEEKKEKSHEDANTSLDSRLTAIEEMLEKLMGKFQSDDGRHPKEADEKAKASIRDIEAIYN